MRFGLTESDIEKINRVFSGCAGIQKAVLYGSRAKGNYKPYSDIDLALDGTGLDMTALGKIADEIDYLLLPYKIDMCILDKIKNSGLIGHINRAGKIFYQRETGVVCE